jgi:two-component system chemotaxis response regulator CheB
MHRDIIVMGASAGGVEALSEVVSGLPRDLNAAVFICLHLPPTAVSVLPTVLQRHTALDVASAADGEPIKPGRIYVAPPDHHLLLRRGTVRLSRGPKENGHRPAVDTLFRSAASAYGRRVIGVVLSGTLDDGARGLHVIRLRGGAAVVQDPDDAVFPGMPASALEAVPNAIRATTGDMGALLGRLSESPIQVEGREPMADEQGADEVETSDGWLREREATPSVFTCPECHGTLFLTEGGGVESFRCRVGHGFSAESLLADQSGSLEAALWTALRALEERNDLMRRMTERARQQGQLNAAERFEERVVDGDRNIGLIKQVLLSGETARDRSG